MTESSICPRCKQAYVGYPALSRRDNKTEICSPCGLEEAMVDLVNHLGYGQDPSWTALQDEREANMKAHMLGSSTTQKESSDELESN